MQNNNFPKMTIFDDKTGARSVAYACYNAMEVSRFQMTIEDKTLQLLPDSICLAPLERQLFAILADGQLHNPKDLLSQLFDEHADRSHLHHLIYRLRAKIRCENLDVIAQSFGTGCKYRLIRPI